MTSTYGPKHKRSTPCATRTIIFQRDNSNYLHVIVCFTWCTLFFQHARLVANMFGVAGSFFELKFSGDLKCNMLVIKYILDGTVIQKFLAFLENFWAISVDFKTSCNVSFFPVQHIFELELNSVTKSIYSVAISIFFSSKLLSSNQFIETFFLCISETNPFIET